MNDCNILENLDRDRQMFDEIVHREVLLFSFAEKVLQNMIAKEPLNEKSCKRSYKRLDEAKCLKVMKKNNHLIFPCAHVLMSRFINNL